MATIDNLDLSVYNLYALRTKMMEEIQTQFRLEEAVTIPAQLKVVDISPRLTELDILLGVVPMSTPWAYFLPPKAFRESIRRSPFSFSRVAPSLGTAEEQEAALAQIQSTRCSSPEEKEEKEIILKCFSQLETINDWMGFIIGRIGQFLKG